MEKETMLSAVSAIRALVGKFEPESPIGAAFAGCCELAEENIENSTAYTMQGLIDGMARDRESLAQALAEAKLNMDAANCKIAEQADSLKWYARTITEREEYKRRAEAAEKELKRIKSAIIDSVMNAITSGRWLENGD